MPLISPVGDRVLATDPETGETSVQTVTAEGTATQGHPFWVPELGEWIDATDLAVSQWLQTGVSTCPSTPLDRPSDPEGNPLDGHCLAHPGQ